MLHSQLSQKIWDRRIIMWIFVGIVITAIVIVICIGVVQAFTGANRYMHGEEHHDRDKA